MGVVLESDSEDEEKVLPQKKGGILRFRGIYVYFFSFLFFFVALLLLLLLSLLLLRALRWGMMIFEFNSFLSLFLFTLCGGFKRA